MQACLKVDCNFFGYEIDKGVVKAALGSKATRQVQKIILSLESMLIHKSDEHIPSAMAHNIPDDHSRQILLISSGTVLLKLYVLCAAGSRAGRTLA
jgi:hypothetical protein